MPKGRSVLISQDTVPNEERCTRPRIRAKRIVRLCQALDVKRGVGRVLGRQLIRSGTSVGANVEEGQASQSRADFAAKYSIACKEARETHYWLRLLAATDLIGPDHLQPLLQEGEDGGEEVNRCVATVSDRDSPAV